MIPAVRPTRSAGLPAPRLTLSLALAVAALFAALPATGHAAATVGSDLAAATVAYDVGCEVGESCTRMLFSYDGAPASSPEDGVVVRWRAYGKGTVRLRLVRQEGDVWVAGPASGPATFTTPGEATFETRLPIQAGDFLAVDGDTDSHVALGARPGAQTHFWFPGMQDGDRRGFSYFRDDLEPLVSADVEPDADGDGYGDETQDCDPGDAAVYEGCDGETGTPPGDGGTTPPGDDDGTPDQGSGDGGVPLPIPQTPSTPDGGTSSPNDDDGTPDQGSGDTPADTGGPAPMEPYVPPADDVALAGNDPQPAAYELPPWDFYVSTEDLTPVPVEDFVATPSDSDSSTGESGDRRSGDSPRRIGDGTVAAGAGTGATRCVVPRLRGVRVAAAKKALRAAGCRPGAVKKVTAKRGRRGRVVRQSPRAGRTVAAGTRVKLRVRR